MSEAVDLPEDATTVVREFLAALQIGEIGEALELVHPDIVWRNTGAPAVRGRDRVRWVLDKQRAARIDLSARIEHIAEDHGSVLVERIDDLRFGPLQGSFFVWARFDIRDGKIVYWHDRYSPAAVIGGVARGLFDAARGRGSDAR